MKVTLDKAFAPERAEEHWYERWQQAGCFDAKDQSEKPAFCIMIPPPNVTGSLHMGHALDETLQDILVRFKRMDGFNTLWMPGTDHAGIATQNVVERELASRGIQREKLGREKFIEEVWRWKEKSGGKIVEQLKRLGASCDWQRQRFTMDEGLSRAVRHVFVELYQQKLLYRGDYIINWCPHCKTALSDLEVEHQDLPGKLYTLRYPRVNSSDAILVATTRPETMLGDVAVAVHPDDPRYQSWIGKQLVLPLTSRQIPIVADTMVKLEFGTGAVKITPAHDFNDFETAQRQGLPSLNIMDDSAHIELPGSKYHGMSTKVARQAVVADLEAAGLLVKEEPHPHTVGHCYRCRTVVEPRISKQWFVRMQTLADAAVAAVKSKKTVIVPETWEKNYFEWMANIRDWCISRQIWWGHRIPVWYCQDCPEIIVSKTDPTQCTACQSKTIYQDEDVLDTWFSSALWPFSTLGWPDKTPALKTFYPTSTLVTGFDILFFWVARMMMMGLKFMGEVPFRTVCLHALVRDAEGHKMSKSKGNAIDPLQIMDKYGTDALRFTLTALAVQGRDIALAEERIVGYRNFVNKIWNASRFVMISVANLQERLNLPASKFQATQIDCSQLSAVDLWINAQLSQCIVDTRLALEQMRFNDAANRLYHFVWHQFCDWYIEMTKSHLSIPADGVISSQTTTAAVTTATNLIFVLDNILHLLHPIMPFVTEELWQKLMTMLDEPKSDFLMLSAYPQPIAVGDAKTQQAVIEIDLMQRLVSAIRSLKSENTIPPAKQVRVMLHGANHAQEAVLRNQWASLKNLARLDMQTADQLFVDKATIQKTTGPQASSIVDGIEVFLPLGDLIDIDKEKSRLQREIAKLDKEMQRYQGKLSNREFVQNAPAEVVEQHRAKTATLVEELKSLQQFLARLGK